MKKLLIAIATMLLAGAALAQWPFNMGMYMGGPTSTNVTWNPPYTGSLQRVFWGMTQTNGTAVLDTGGAGGNYHATNTPSVGGGPTRILSTNQNGDVTAHYQFDASDDALLAPTNSVQTADGDPFTALWWTKTRSGAAVSSVMFDIGQNATGQRFAPIWDLGGTANLYINYVGKDQKTADNTMQTGTWIHVAVVYPGGLIDTNNPLIYLDAVLQTNVTLQGAAITDIGIGDTAPDSADIGDSGDYDGELDGIEFIFTNITPTQVTNYYQNTHPTNNIRSDEQ